MTKLEGAAISVHRVEQLSQADLSDLAAATKQAIEHNLGFGWLAVPSNQVLEQYWQGVLLMPSRILFIGRLDNVVAGSVQLLLPPPSKETSAFAVNLDSHFVAPWARGHGLARALLARAEHEAASLFYRSIRLSVRHTQTRAIELYRENSYIEWGLLPDYEFVAGQMVSGVFFYKNLSPPSSIA